MNRKKFSTWVRERNTFFVEVSDDDDSKTPATLKLKEGMSLPKGIMKIHEAFKNEDLKKVQEELHKQYDEPEHHKFHIGKVLGQGNYGEGNKWSAKQRRKLKLVGNKLYVSGDAVRDYIMQIYDKQAKSPCSYELVTEARPEAIQLILLNSKNPICNRYVSEGVVEALVDDEIYEINTSRNEKSFTALDGDISRRDLTCNALYYDIEGKQILDFCGGLTDIQRGQVRFIGNYKENLQKNSSIILDFANLHSRINPNGPESIPEHVRNFLRSYPLNLPKSKLKNGFLEGLKSAGNLKNHIRTYENLGILAKAFPGLSLNTDLHNNGNHIIMLASLLRNNPPEQLQEALSDLPAIDSKNIAFLLNTLKWDSPDSYSEFDSMRKKTGITDRTILGWAKLNHLDEKVIKGFLNH